jgi:hypothetical protein
MPSNDPLTASADAKSLETSNVASVITPATDAAAARPPAGQLGTFAVIGAAVGTVPLPWLPDALTRRLRGALVQDIAARHGLALTPDARQILADPKSSKKKRGPLSQALTFLGRKLLVRFGPLAMLPTLRAGLETYVLGHLFDRYLSLARAPSSGAVRIDAPEAQRVREAIERAVVRVASPETGLEWPTTPLPPEESRDEITQALDGLLSATTTIPSWLLHRLDDAFDDVVALPP